MTFTSAINLSLEKIYIKLNYPINILMGYKNSEYIDIELFGTNKKIDEILNNAIIDNDLSVIYENEKKEVCFDTNGSLSVIYSNNLSIEEILDSYKYLGSTQDNKFNIYLFLLPENNKILIDGIIRIDDEIQYPEINVFKYQNLYNYQDEEAFINAIYIEFIIRNARYNNLLLSNSTIKENIIDGETDYDFDYRTMMLLEEKREIIDKILLNSYGLDFYQITRIDLIMSKDRNLEESKNISFKLKSIEPAHKNIVLSINLPREELLNKVNELKDEYEKNKNSFIPLKEKLNKNFVEEADNIINKFPMSFKKKQDQLIKALFIFDYIESHNKAIDELNIPIKEKYEATKIEISNKYLKKQEQFKKEVEIFKGYKKEADNLEERIKIEKQSSYQKTINMLEKNIKNLERNERKELLEAKKEMEENLSYHTKMDPLKYKDSIFNEIALLIGEKSKQCTKVHNFIHKFLKKQIII